MPHFATLETPVASLPAVQPVTVGASPFVYAVPMDGVVSINGGTVSLVTYTRAGTVVGLGLIGGVIPVFKGDVLTVTWAVTPPVVQLIPGRK